MRRLHPADGTALLVLPSIINHISGGEPDARHIGLVSSCSQLDAPGQPAG
jgi:hypothetical protein